MYEYGQACTWVWDDWDDRDPKGIWELYASIYIFNAHLLICCVFLLCLLPPQPPYKGSSLRPPPFVEAAAGRLLYMVAGEVASIAKTYRRISKCALNMYIDAYSSNIPLESPSSQSSHTHLQACPPDRRPLLFRFGP